jgi:hypothetical protein
VPNQVSTDAVMSDLRSRVRARLREELVREGATGFADPAAFDEVERLLQSAVKTADERLLLLPELLGDPDSWQLRTGLQFDSHRPGGQAGVIRFFKQRVVMPLVRWLFDYTHDNFERQRRVNLVLFACVQELAIETARLRQEARRQTS